MVTCSWLDAADFTMANRKMRRRIEALAGVGGRFSAVPRRTWLPSPHYLRELASNPAMAMRLADPRNRCSANALSDGAKLIGLMLSKDEADMLPESLGHLAGWFDAIYVLEGTRSEGGLSASRSVYEDLSVVQGVFLDQQVSAEARNRDGCRQILLDAARTDHGVDNWIVILHGDEVIQQDPRLLLSTLNPTYAPSLRVRVVHHFLHTELEASWENLAGLPVRRRVDTVMWPGVPETRFFFDRGIRDYLPDQHSQVVPRSFRVGPLIEGYVIHQFNYRTPEQALARAADRIERGWQSTHYQRLQAEQSVYTESLYQPDLESADYEHLDSVPPTVVRSSSTVPWIDIDSSTTDSRQLDLDSLEPSLTKWIETCGQLIREQRPEGPETLKRHLDTFDIGSSDTRLGAVSAARYLRRGLMASRTSNAERIAFLDEFVRGLVDGPSGAMPPSKPLGLAAGAPRL